MKNIKVLIIALFAFVVFANTQGYAGAPGVSADVNSALTAKFNVQKKFDKAESEAVVISKPLSVAALSCFNLAVDAFSKGAGKLYSGDFSNQVKEPVEEGLQPHFDNLKWNDVISYDGNISATTSIKVVFEANISGSDSFSGPTIKNFNCDNMQKAWVSKRNEGLKRTPTFDELMNKVRGGVVDEGNRIDKDITKSAADAKKDIEELDKRKATVLSVDKPFSKNATVCGALIEFFGGGNTDCPVSASTNSGSGGGAAIK